MASIITAYKNILTDNFWGLKLLCLTGLAFGIFYNQSSLSTNMQNYIAAWGLFIVFMLGVSGFLMNRNINNRTPLLPGLIQLPLVIKDSICMTILMLPFSLIMYFAIKFYNDNFTFEEVALNYFFIAAIVIVCVPFIFIPTVLYAVRGNILDGYRVNLIALGAGNFVVQFLSFILQFLFTILIAAILAYELFLEMLGPETVFIPLTFAFFSVLSILVFFSFCSDLYIDVIPEIKDLDNFRDKTAKKKKHHKILED